MEQNIVFGLLGYNYIFLKYNFIYRIENMGRRKDYVLIFISRKKDNILVFVGKCFIDVFIVVFKDV